MVGGGGERKTLRLVAKYADACNVFAAAGAGTDEVAHKLAVLRDWCEREGRPYGEIRKTVLYNGLVGQDAVGAAAFVEEMRALADVGVDEVHVMPLRGDPVAFVRSLGDLVVPPLAQV
jgi:alkanesulfonate monooxygenase SsuD/methylene tetrahydromethanopterin reductase-like flavin-dependent oxidoreductase (luciferase family)